MIALHSGLAVKGALVGRAMTRASIQFCEDTDAPSMLGLGNIRADGGGQNDAVYRPTSDLSDQKVSTVLDEQQQTAGWAC